MSHTVALADIFLHCHEHINYSQSNKHILLLQILKHQMCINPHLKIVPNKHAIYSSLSNVC